MTIHKHTIPRKGFTQHHRTGAGFTLVEMLVAVSIFSVVVIASTDIFIRTQRAQRQAAALEKVQDTTRFLLTRIAQELRTGHIDYEYYKTSLTADPHTITSDTAIASETLAIKNTDGKTLLFTVRQKDHTDFGGVCGSDEKTAPCLVLAVPDTNQHERATPEGYTIQKLAFYITPPVDSLAIDNALNDYPSDIQPRVTLMLSARGDLPGISKPIDLSVQTTLSSREYVR